MGPKRVFLSLSPFVLTFFIVVGSLGAARAELPAFPGAEGFGAMATGGRGGRVIKVTNLGSEGPGSLQEAVNQSEPRIVVFSVSGEIFGDLVIPHGDLTIAGQTAPGAGITIRGRLLSNYEIGINNIIIRHLRIRPPVYAYSSLSGDQVDAVTFSRNQRFIFDHISASWGIDETIDLYSAREATVQWSTIEESATFGHPKGLHNLGLINGKGGGRLSVHHNLFAHHAGRCPAVATGPAEVVNNLIYNVKKGFHHDNAARGQFQLVGNYYRRGPSSVLRPIEIDYSGKPGVGLSYYFSDLCIDDPGDFVGVVNRPAERPYTHSSFSYNLKKLDYPGVFVLTKPVDFTARYPGHVPVTVQQCGNGAGAVLARAGAFPRDIVTQRIVKEVVERSGSWGIDEPEDLMAGLRPVPPPLDQDNDGMADEWEEAHGLDPHDGSDHRHQMMSGYTAIEEYINELADALLVTAAPRIKEEEIAAALIGMAPPPERSGPESDSVGTGITDMPAPAQPRRDSAPGSFIPFLAGLACLVSGLVVLLVFRGKKKKR